MVTPNRIIEAVRDPHHPHHMKVIAMMNNDGSQKIGRYTPPHRWIYSPQHHYVHQPQFVLLFENLQQEWPVFAQHHRLTVGDIPHQNLTRKRYLEPLTAQSITFLQRFYKRDFELYQHYSELPLRTRISDWHTVTRGIVYSANILFSTSDAVDARSLTNAFEKLSSGLRINAAHDDAAGLAVSEKLRTKTQSLRQARRNANDGYPPFKPLKGRRTKLQTS